MAKMKFDRKNINSIGEGLRVLEDTIENIDNGTYSLNGATPEPEAPETVQGGEVATPETAEVTETSEVVVMPQAKPSEGNQKTSERVAKHKTPKKKSATVSDDEADERTKPVSLYLPMSTYKRLLEMKYNSSMSLKELGLLAIEELLKRKGY